MRKWTTNYSKLRELVSENKETLELGNILEINWNENVDNLLFEFNEIAQVYEISSLKKTFSKYLLRFISANYRKFKDLILKLI